MGKDKKTESTAKLKLLSLAEVANLLGYTTSGFRNFYKRTRPFAAYHIASNRICFKESDILAYIESKKIDAVVV